MNRLLRLARVTSGYALTIGITAVVGLVSLPIVIAVAGAEAWADLAVAQAVGQIAATVVVFGWPVVGPASVAASTPPERSVLYRLSLLSRLVLFAPAAIVSVLWIVLTQTDQPHVVSSIIAGITPIIGALGASWFFVGESKPLYFNLYDVIPRAAGSIAGIGAILLTRDLISFVICQMAGQVLALSLSTVTTLRRYPHVPGSISVQHLAATFRGGFSGFVTSMTSSLYQNLPLILVSSLAPGQLTLYAMADRLMKLGALALTPITQVAQGFVPVSKETDVLAGRIRTAVKIGAVCSLATTIGFTLLAPLAAILLSSGQVSLSYLVTLPLGLALGFSLLGSVVGRACLVPLGLARFLAFSTLAAAAVGIPLVAFATIFAGVAGTVVAVAVAESVALAIVVFALGRRLRKIHREFDTRSKLRQVGLDEASSS